MTYTKLWIPTVQLHFGVKNKTYSTVNKFRQNDLYRAAQSLGIDLTPYGTLDKFADGYYLDNSIKLANAVLKALNEKLKSIGYAPIKEDGLWGDSSLLAFNTWYNSQFTPTTPTTTPLVNPNVYNNLWLNQFSGFGKRGAVRAWLHNNNISNTADLASIIKSDNNVANAFGFDTSKSGWDNNIETQLLNNYGIHGHIGGYDRRRIRELLDNNKDTNPSSPGMWITRGLIPTWLNPLVVNFRDTTNETTPAATKSTDDNLVVNFRDTTNETTPAATKSTDDNLLKYKDLANKKFTFTHMSSPFTGKPLFKRGGMINYYQLGGAAELDPQQLIIALVQAAMQGDKKATQLIQLILAAAEQGDKQAAQIMQYIQQIMQLMLQQTQSAKRGAKLLYLALLRGECPEGTHMEYFKAGGQICKKCMLNKVQEDKCGGKAKKQKMACGGVTKGINLIKAELGNKLKDKKKSYSCKK